MLIIAGPGGLVAFAQPGPPLRKFSIGYLPEGSDIPNAPTRMEELRQYLLGRPELRQAFTTAGFGEIELSPCDVPRDMVQRMNDGEFDLVFATAMIYAQQKGGRYEPILQLKQPTDFIPPAQDSGALREGVIFVGPRSPLFHKVEKPTREDLRRLLEKTPLAVPSADSAVAYLSPRYIMTHDLGLKSFPSPLFCGSDAEVVKHVVSGLAEVGACRTGALKELLGTDGTEPNPYCRRLCKTDPVPTDPILLRAELMPSRAELGIRIKQALRDGFLANSVVNASPRDFEIIVKYLQELQGFHPVEMPVSEPAATPTMTPMVTPTPSATPTPSPTPTPSATPASITTATLTPTPAPARTPGTAPTPPLKPALPTVTPVVWQSEKPVLPMTGPAGHAIKTVLTESAPTPPVPEIRPALPKTDRTAPPVPPGKPALPKGERARTPALPGGKPALPENHSSLFIHHSLFLPAGGPT